MIRDAATAEFAAGVDPAERRAGAILSIDLDAVAANYRLLAAMAAPAECAAVVKADGYGLGIAVVGPALFRAGARTFYVAHLDEAIALRAVLPAPAIAVLNGLLPGSERDYADHRLSPVLNHLGEVERWQTLARTRGVALPCHLHIDTGINRLGLGADELAILAAAPERLAGLAPLTIMSHLACADEADHPMTQVQVERFRAALARLPKAPASLANSSGIFRGRALHFDLVRPGSALYGVNPTPEAPNPMAQVIRLDGRVLQVRCIDSPGTVGYGAAHQATAGSKIATIAVGYADGYLRSLSGRGAVWFGDQPAAVVGRVSMDLITVDVTHIAAPAVQPGQFAEIIGPHRPIDAVAREAGTIGYEILTSLGARYARRCRASGHGR